MGAWEATVVGAAGMRWIGGMLVRLFIAAECEELVEVSLGDNGIVLVQGWGAAVARDGGGGGGYWEGN
jgi:hypothetical protein